MKNPFLSRYARKRFLVPLLIVAVTAIGGGLPPPVAGAVVEAAVLWLSSAQHEE